MALAWTWAAGRAIGEDLPIRIGTGFFLFVWSIYLADRLIDVARCPDWGAVPERLRFGQRYRAVLMGCLLASLGVTMVLAWDLPAPVLHRVGWTAPGVIGYFLLFVAPVIAGRKLPGKEFAVGFFCAVPAWVAFGWHERFAVILPVYALLITLNCLVIASRERDLDGKIDPGAATAWWPGLERDLPKAGLGLAVLSVLLIATGSAAFLGAIAAGAIALMILHRQAPGMRAERVRLLADVCLLIPPLALWIF